MYVVVSIFFKHSSLKLGIIEYDSGNGGNMKKQPAKIEQPESKVDDDPQLAFIYQEAVRGLAHQQGVVESMNARAGNMIFTAAFATSLLGATALSNGLGIWDWIALLLLFFIGALVVFMLWPYHNYTFRFDPEELLSRYADSNKYTMSEMHRTLAMRIKKDMASNWRIIQRLRIALQFSLIFLLLEILALLVSISAQ